MDPKVSIVRSPLGREIMVMFSTENDALFFIRDDVLRKAQTEREKIITYTVRQHGKD
jgi:hypothetical protein